MASKLKAKAPRCILIAGPNGAGKTTFALDFLPHIAKIVHFVNADSIAAGISPLKPEIAAVAAGRILLAELDRLSTAKIDFAFESTLSGLAYAERIKRFKDLGYEVDIHFLRISNPKLSMSRVSARVKQGGHDVPKADILRRFVRGWANFQNVYRPLADFWAVFDNSGSCPRIVETGIR